MKGRQERLGSAVLAASLALMGGCASGPSGRRGASAGVVMPVVDPATRAAVESRALGILTAAALGADALLKANAIEGLHAAPERVEPIVRAALADDNLGVRFVAAMTVGTLRLGDSTMFVEPLLRDPAPEVRAAAIYALRRNGVDADPTPLATMLESQTMRERAQAAYILGELGDRSAVALLRSAAKRSAPLASKIEDRLARLQIAEALVKLGDTDAIETLRAALYPSRPEDLEATALAVQIIGNVGDRRSIDQLVYLTARTGRDRLPAEVRLAAARSMANLGNRRGSFIAEEFWRDPSPAIRAQSAFVFGETVGPDNLSRLTELMEDPSSIVQVSAAAATLRMLRRDRPSTAFVDSPR